MPKSLICSQLDISHKAVTRTKQYEKVQQDSIDLDSQERGELIDYQISMTFPWKGT